MKWYHKKDIPALLVYVVLFMVIHCEIREKISSETANMSFAELKKYIEQRVEKD